MKCPYCQAEISASDRFCGTCGGAISIESFSSNPPALTESKHLKKTAILSVLLAVAAIIGWMSRDALHNWLPRPRTSPTTSVVAPSQPGTTFPQIADSQQEKKPVVLTSPSAPSEVQGHIKENQLGIVIRDLTQDLALAFYLPETHGAVIVVVRSGSAAAAAGIEAGDIVLSVNEKSVKHSDDVTDALGLCFLCEEIRIELLHYGDRVLRIVKMTASNIAKQYGEKIQPSENLRPKQDQEDKEKLKSRAYAPRGWLGLTIQDLTRDLAESFGTKKPKGAVVTRILPDSPAEAAGLQIGDIITEFNDRDISDAESLLTLVAHTKAGDSGALKFIRQGQVKGLKVEIGAVANEQKIQAKEKVTTSGLVEEDGKKLHPALSGAILRNANPGSQVKGVWLLGKIDTGSSAYLGGLQPGDVIVMANREEVTNLEDLKRTAEQGGRKLRLLIRRGEDQFFLVLR